MVENISLNLPVLSTTVSMVASLSMELALNTKNVILWRKKKTQITSLSSSSSSSSPSSSSSSSSEDWIRDFHARYNPLQTERSPYTTSTPVRTHITAPTLNLTGVKIYEDFEDLEGILEETDTSFDVVNVNNIVIAKAVFPTLRSHKNSIP